MIASNGKPARLAVLAMAASICALGVCPAFLHADTITVVGAGGEIIAVTTSTTGNATITSTPNTATITGTTGDSGIYVSSPSAGTLLGAVTITNSSGFSILSTVIGGGTPPTNNGIYGAVDVSRATSLTLTNEAGASITGPNGIFYDMPSSSGVLSSVTNSGIISGVGGPGANGAGIASFANTSFILNNSGAMISGAAYGIQVANSGNLDNLNNAGSIQGGSFGVAVSGAGNVTNFATGSITSANGIGIQIIGFGTVNNAGSISSSNRGVYIKGGGSLDNSGSITTSNTAANSVFFLGAGTVTSSGSIVGTNLGILLSSGGTVTNSGTISSGGGMTAPSVTFGGLGNLNNSGTIIGSVAMGDFANTVTLFTGGAINGNLNMSANAGTTLTLDGTGTQTYSTAVAGTTTFNGTLVKQGSGTWSLDTPLSFAGGTTVGAGRLAVNTTVAGNVLVQTAAQVGGHGIIGGTISGAGTVGQLNSPGILTATAVNPSGGLAFNLVFTQAGAPIWSNAASSGNDVLHLNGTTPFTLALTSANNINVYFASSALTYQGGLFINGAVDTLTASLANAAFHYYLLDNANTNGTLYNGNYYDLILGSTATLQVVGANFGDGTVSGFTEQFTPVVPEPSTLVLLGIGLLGYLVTWRDRWHFRVR